MQLSMTGFWARLYRDCRAISCEFFYLREDRGAKTNLCTFIRTIFVAAPLAILLNAFAVGALLLSVALLVFLLFYHLSTIGALILIIAAIGAAVGLVCALIAAAKVVHAGATNSETLHIASEYLSAKKAKICPIISFGDQP